MSITPGGIHDQAARVRADGLGEGFGALLDDDVAPTDLAWHRGVDGRAVRIVAVLQLGDDNLILETGLSLENHIRACKSQVCNSTYSLALDGGAVDSNVPEVSEQLLRTVLALDELEELGRVIDELCYMSISRRTSSIDRHTVVQVLPPTKTSCVSRRNRKGMLVYAADQ